MITVCAVCTNSSITQTCRCDSDSLVNLTYDTNANIWSIQQDDVYSFMKCLENGFTPEMMATRNAISVWSNPSAAADDIDVCFSIHVPFLCNINSDISITVMYNMCAKSWELSQNSFDNFLTCMNGGMDKRAEASFNRVVADILFDI